MTGMMYCNEDDLVSQVESGVREIPWNFKGAMAKVGNHYILKLGCETHVVHTAKEAGKVLEKALKKEFESNDK